MRTMGPLVRKPIASPTPQSTAHAREWRSASSMWNAPKMAMATPSASSMLTRPQVAPSKTMGIVAAATHDRMAADRPQMGRTAR